MAEKAKLLHRKMSKTWWLEKPAYTVFMLREFSSIFVALVAVGTILQVSALKNDSYGAFAETLAGPGMTVFGVVALGFALLHSVTFFQAAGKVFVIRMGETRVPESVVIWGHFAAWVALSLLIGWLVLL